VAEQWQWNLNGSPASVSGFTVGHAQVEDAPCGLSVVLCPEETVGAIHVAGSAAGTRQTDGLRSGHLVDRVNAVLLTGGSAFGLDAAGGVVSYLSERGVGVPVGPCTVPIVPTAVIFDLAITQGKGRPDGALARLACEQAADGPMARGNVGAGAGATIGKLFGLEQACKGGLGGASLRVGDLELGAMAVVNAFGDIIDEAGRIIAGARKSPESREFINTASWFLAGNHRQAPQTFNNTTLVVVTCNAKLDKKQAQKVAALAQHGLVRAIEPVHTTFDGDMVFVLGCGSQEVDVNGLGIMAAHLVRRAILDAVRAAQPLAGLPAACDLTPMERG
jgi:L-aminopeptidase/D-esterase-like protein